MYPRYCVINSLKTKLVSIILNTESVLQIEQHLTSAKISFLMLFKELTLVYIEKLWNT